MNVPTDMQDFFFEPIDQLLGFDVNFTPSTDYDQDEEEVRTEEPEEITQKEKDTFLKKEREIEESMSQEATEYIEMKCPHCGEIIRMKK